MCPQTYENVAMAAFFGLSEKFFVPSTPLYIQLFLYKHLGSLGCLVCRAINGNKTIYPAVVHRQLFGVGKHRMPKVSGLQLNPTHVAFQTTPW